MSDKDKNIELRSDAVRDIIGRPPSWLVRWGTITFAGIVVLLLVGSAWFNYPDKLASTITLISDMPPAEIMAKNSGLIETLFVKDSQFVEAGTELALIESSVSYDFVESIRKELDSLIIWISQDSLNEITRFVKTERAQPGELKNNFSSLTAALNSYLAFCSLNKYYEKIKAIHKEIGHTRIHYDRLFEQKELKEEELEIAKKQLKRQKDLYDSGTISPVEYELSSKEYLVVKFSFEETRSSLSAYQIQLDNLEQEIQDLKNLDSEDRHKLISEAETRITELKGAISEWELAYLLRSPIAGRVSFTSYWIAKQGVTLGEKVMTIIQEDQEKIVGKLALPVSGSGKAAVGQTVLVKVDKYPHLEYGVLKGIVKQISLVADQDYFVVEVEFPDRSRSSYNIKLSLNQGMTGQAEIITENQSFLVRIINPIRYLMNRNKAVD